MDAWLSNLVMALRCLISIGIVFCPALALLPSLSSKKKGILLGILILFGLAGSALIVIFYALGPDYYTLLEFLYLPLIIAGVLLALPFYRKKIWYFLFVFTLTITLYLILNFPTEILRRYFPDPVWGECLYLVIRLLWCGGLVFLFYRFLRPRMLEAEAKIGRRFLYPFLLNLLILGLLIFIGIFPKMWYKRDSSVFYLIGYAAIFIPVAYLLIYRFIRVLLQENAESQNEALYALKAAGLEEQVNQDEAYRKEIAKTRHDLHHHIEALLGLLHEKKDEEAIHYLQSYSAELSPSTPFFHTGSYPLDAILSIYEKKAKEAGIAYEIALNLPSKFPLNDTETITLFANVLENALHGALASKAEHPFIKVQGQSLKSFFRLEASNSSLAVTFKDGLPLRHDGSKGIGTEQINSLFKKHEGMINFTSEKGTFKVEGALPLLP
jgi:hypothetical protein